CCTIESFSQCCDEGETCCSGICLNKTDEVCCGTGEYASCCSKDKICCGFSVKIRRTCCGSGELGHFCDENETCCGLRCHDNKDGTCCGTGELAQICDEGESCCGSGKLLIVALKTKYAAKMTVYVVKRIKSAAMMVNAAIR
ncbi:709_t:CDS:10, partial [Gigaspora rosea]